MQDIQALSASSLPDYIVETLNESRAKSKTIVLVTGVFDVLHKEHEIFLKKAAKLGDVLVIAVESDLRVRSMKGEGRPVNPQSLRVKKLFDLGVSKNIFVLPNEFSEPQNHIDLIETIRPAILAVSSHTAHLAEKTKIMNMVEGKLVVVHDHNPEISSSKIINDK